MAAQPRVMNSRREVEVDESIFDTGYEVAQAVALADYEHGQRFSGYRNHPRSIDLCPIFLQSTSPLKVLGRLNNRSRLFYNGLDRDIVG